MQETEKNKKIAEDKVTTLEQQKEKLSADINDLSTTEGKEKLFRENFGLAKDGEDMIVIVEDKNPPVAPKPASSGFFSFLKNKISINFSTFYSPSCYYLFFSFRILH